MLMRSFIASNPVKVESDPVARRYVADVLFHSPLVVFGLDRCESSRSVREFFDRLRMPHRFVDLDSADYRENEFGRRIRAVIADIAGEKELPQIFLGGEHIGDAAEVFKLWRTGVFQILLAGNGVNYDRRHDVGSF